MPIFNNSYGQSHRWSIRLIPVVLALIVAVGYYLGNQEVNPYTGRKQMITLSVQDELSLGLQSYKQVLRQSHVITQGSQYEMVKRVGQKIAQVSDNKVFQWQFSLIDSPQANAFCLPGGKVAVYSGILKITENEDALAAVMGHEIAHALARHGAERMAHQSLARIGQFAIQIATGDMDYNQRRAIQGAFGIGAQYGVLLPFSRDHESEADRLGLMLAAKACFDPREAPKFWQRMGAAHKGKNPPEFMSTHPSDVTRIEQLQQMMPEALRLRGKNCL